MNKNFQVIGHRGIAASYPENTLISFEKAVEAGVDAIEFDVHTTRDGQLVITHDHTVERCSNGTGQVHDFTFEEIRKLDFGAWKGPEFAGARIPTLDETLDAIFAKRPDMYLLIELKEDDESCARQVLETMRKREILDHALVLSFHPAMLKLLHRLEPKIVLQGFPDRYVKNPPPDSYSYFNKTCIWTSEVSAEEIQFFHRRNIAVDLYPVDNAATLEKVMPLDIDSITTNAADVIMPLLRQKGFR